MKSIFKWKNFMNRVLGAACAVLLAFMSLLTCYQVFMRYVVKNPSTISEDILSYSFVWVSLMASALVFGERDHMNLTFFLEKMSPIVKLVLQIFSEALILLVAVVVFMFGGNKFMAVGALQISPTLGITMNLVYSILPVCGIMIAVYSIINTVELVIGYKDGKEKGL